MKFVWPASSLVIAVLCQKVQEAGYSADDLRKLLWLINAHPELLGFGQISENLYTIFSSAPFQSIKPQDYSWADKIHGWSDIVDWINKNRETLSVTPELSSLYVHPGQKNIRHPLSRSGLTRHGFYASLWNRHESGDGILSGSLHCIRYQCLQAQFCIAHMTALALHSKQDEYDHHDKDQEFCGKPIQIYPSSFVIRELSWNKYWSMLDAMAPETGFNNCQEHLEVLASKRTAIPGVSASDAQNFISKTSSYLTHVAEELRTGKTLTSPTAPIRSGGSGGGKIHHGFVNINSHVFRSRSKPEEYGLEPELGSVDIVFLRNEENDLEEERSGEAPREHSRPMLALYSPEEFGGAMGRARYAERIKTTAAQRFMWDENQLTDTEISRLKEHLKGIFNQYTIITKPKVKETELCQGALLVEVMFCFGVSLESARNLRLRKFDTNPVAEFALLVRPDGNGDDQVFGWRIPGVRPNYQTHAPIEFSVHNRNMVESYVVPDMTGLGERILAFLNRTQRTHERIFSFEPKTALDNFKSVVSMLADESRFNEGRVTRALGNQVMSQTGDQTLAWCVSGNTLKGNEPRMFYTVYPVQRLVAGYVAGIRKLFGLLPCDKNLFPPHSLGYIGARFVVSSETVRKCLALIKEKLQSKPNPMNFPEIVRYHNYFTLYTWLVQAFCSALRAINNPSELLEQLEVTFGVHSLSDKEGIHRDRARPFFLPQLLRIQLSHYQHHRDYLVNSLGLHDGIQAGLRDQLRLFSLDSRDKPQILTRSWIESELEQLGFALPGNFHRAFLRSELLESGCPSQTVDAFLGHAHKGESPFDAYSSFDYQNFKETLTSYLDPLFQHIGLDPIYSHLSPTLISRAHFCAS
jgi:hypothetical protein